MTFCPPVDPNNSFLTSGYGERPSRRTGRPTFHAGLDFRGARGDPIFAVADGVVDIVHEDVRGRWESRGTHGYGLCFSIHHGQLEQWTVYAHLSERLVGPGDTVHAGQLIARCGNTSNGKFPGMGPHLHFEVRNPRPGEGAPFPGPYRRYNIDPQPWLEAKGIGLRRRGFELTGAAADPTTLPGALAGLPSLPPVEGVQEATRTRFAGRRAFWLQQAGLGRCRELEAYEREGWSLGGLGDVSGTLDLDAEGLPAEPLRDPWTFDPPNASVLIGIATAGVLSVAGGAWIVNAARKS